MNHSRHDERLLPGLTQHPVHEQRTVGEAVLAPLSPLVKAQPAKTNSRHVSQLHSLPPLCAEANDPESCLTSLFHIPRRAEALRSMISGARLIMASNTER